MGGLLWRASCENTSIPGGPLALQVKPRLNVSRADWYTSAYPTREGRPRNYDWQTAVIGIHEVSVAPTIASTAGMEGRPVVGRIAPAWRPAHKAVVTPFHPREDLVRVMPGYTRNGTECGGPTFLGQATLPATGGVVHQIYRMRFCWPSTAPFIVYGCGTMNTDTDTVLPHPAFVLYVPCGQMLVQDRSNMKVFSGGRSGIIVGNSDLVRIQTYYGEVVFEEM